MALSLQQKITDPKQGVYLIGTTPPKADTAADKVDENCQQTVEAIK
ncbi:MAG: hypothetical protein U5L01_08750 [Rheinheimera sp.]|nr:hypothetical protein [Rheinheimera sp.]